MADHYHPGLTEWFNYWDAWHKWADQRPSRWHPIKYIKWYFNEPQYGKENNK